MASPLTQQLAGLSAPAPMSRAVVVTDFNFFLSWFLLIALVAWVLIFTVKPQFVQNEDGTLNYGKVLLWAVVFAVIVVVVLWLARSATRFAY